MLKYLLPVIALCAAGSAKTLLEYGSLTFEGGDGSRENPIIIKGIQPDQDTTGIERLYLDKFYPLGYSYSGVASVSGSDDPNSPRKITTGFDIYSERSRDSSLYFRYELPSLQKSIAYGDQSGVSPREAVTIRGIRSFYDEKQAVRDYISRHYPDSTEEDYRTIEAPVTYQRVTIATSDGKEIVRYFNLNDPGIKPAFARYPRDIADLIPPVDKASWQAVDVPGIATAKLPGFMFSLRHLYLGGYTEADMAKLGMPPISQDQLNEFSKPAKREMRGLNVYKTVYDFFESDEASTTFQVSFILHGKKDPGIKSIQDMAAVLNNESYDMVDQSPCIDTDKYADPVIASGCKVLTVNKRQWASIIGAIPVNGSYRVNHVYYYYSPKGDVLEVRFSYDKASGVNWRGYISRIMESMDTSPLDQQLPMVAPGESSPFNSFRADTPDTATPEEDAPGQ